MAGEGRVSTAWGFRFSPVELPAGKGQGSEREEGCEVFAEPSGLGQGREGSQERTRRLRAGTRGRTLCGVKEQGVCGPE